MKTFEEYQTLATRLPLALRNDRDRIDLPVSGLQQEAGKIGSILATGFAAGKFNLTTKQTSDLKDSVADVLWCLALLCKETGMPMQEIAEHSLQQLQARAKDFDPDQR